MKKLLTLLVILLILFACFPLWLPGVGGFLLVSDRPNQAEAIVAVRGRDAFKFQKAVDLLNQGIADKIVICDIPEQEAGYWANEKFKNRILGGDEISPREFVERAFRYLGVNDPTVLTVLEKPVTSTFSEAVAVRDWVNERGIQSFILVASTYHMRRALLIFSLVFKNSGVEIYPVTAVDPIFHPEHWWRYERDVKRVLEEYLSIVFNVLYHFVLGRDVTSFDTI